MKPANISITRDGAVKVLDFGLAKAWSGEGVAPDLSPPTATATALLDGVVRGTPAYMSPEQARGQVVDKRSDIWAFGCVLYEMLTGRRAFSGETVSETLAEVMKSEPSWVALPRDMPPTLRSVVRRCLVKDPRQRLRDIGDVRLALDGAFETAASVDTLTVAVPRLRFWQRPLPLALVIVTLIVATGLGVWAFTRPAPPRVVRMTVTPSGAIALSLAGFFPAVAISPDGARLAYVGAGGQQIVVRSLDQVQPITLAGLGMPGSLFFSPDGQSIGFFDGVSALKKVAATGGAPTTISRIAGNPFSASWSSDDTIIFATNDPGSGLLRVAAAGGQPEVLTTPNLGQGELDHSAPEVLPGGQAVLFTIFSTSGGYQVAVLDVTTREQKILIRGGGFARYVPTGHLVYYVGGAEPLRAVPFDLRQVEVFGTPVPVLEQEVTAANAGNMILALDGTLVYVTGGAQALSTSTMVWVDRQGREEPLEAPPRYYRYPRLSPDGARVALDIGYSERDIWIWDFARETLTRLTFDPRVDSHPAWTPDGQRLVFRSARSGPSNLFWQAADGTGPVERLTENQNSEQFPGAFSPDGTRLVFREETTTSGADLMVLALESGLRTPPPSQGVGGRSSTTGDVRPLVRTSFNELNGEISPDGQWLAYESDESGREEVYVRPFPDVDRGRWQISTGGGNRPLWARSGKEFFYRALGGAVMRASVGEGSAFRAGSPTRLFEGRYEIGSAQSGRTYDISPDGQRFLMFKLDARSDETATPPSIVIVQNWSEELKRRVPRN